MGHDRKVVLFSISVFHRWEDAYCVSDGLIRDCTLLSFLFAWLVPIEDSASIRVGHSTRKPLPIFSIIMFTVPWRHIGSSFLVFLPYIGSYPTEFLEIPLFSMVVAGQEVFFNVPIVLLTPIPTRVNLSFAPIEEVSLQYGDPDIVKTAFLG